MSTCVPTSISVAYLDEASRRDSIVKDWGIQTLNGSKLLPCGVDSDFLLDINDVRVKRHPVNDRHSDSLMEEYSMQIRTTSYEAKDCGAIHVIATDASISS